MLDQTSRIQIGSSVFPPLHCSRVSNTTCYMILLVYVFSVQGGERCLPTDTCTVNQENVWDLVDPFIITFSGNCPQTKLSPHWTLSFSANYFEIKSLKNPVSFVCIKEWKGKIMCDRS